MSDIKDPKRLAGIDRCLEDYFHSSLVPIMDRVEKQYRDERVKEMRNDISSPAGILSSMTGHMPDTLNAASERLRITGQWSSKNAEDYAEDCRRQFAGSEEIRQRIGLLTDEWRKAIVAEVGEKRYNELSEQLGGDLASAYIEWRIGEMMTDRMASKEIPQSSAEYIMSKASQNSLFSLNGEYFKSSLDHEIESRAEALYKPTIAERGAGRVIGAGMDTVLTCGSLSWTALARFVGYDVAIGAAADAGGKILDRKSPGVDECISKGLFGTRHNVMDDVRHLGRLMDVESDSYTLALSEALKGREKWWYDQYENGAEEKPAILEVQHQEEKTAVQTEIAETEEPAKQAAAEPVQANADGWDGFMNTVGLDSMGDLTHNLGYVMAMLPDVLVGMFTGKSHSLAIKDNLMPIAAILGGLFVRSPLLKILLIGMGGANLMNKAGHEALEMRRKEEHAPRYKVYEDEPLNKRIENPALKGSQLVMSIDKVPYSIQLPDNVIDAYSRGALPLNRLANAVLAKTDESNRLLAEKYEAETRNEQTMKIQ